MNINTKYRKSLDEKWCLRFKTRHPDGDNFDGVIMRIEREFIVLREAIDFDFDGIVILPKKSIKGYRDAEFERCFNKILRERGALNKCRMPRWLNRCETLPEVLKELKRRDIWPAVETIFNGDSKSALYIGPITRATADYFYLKCYDAAGKWEKKYKLTYEEIFKVELDGKYCNRFNAYMRRRDGSH